MGKFFPFYFFLPKALSYSPQNTTIMEPVRYFFSNGINCIFEIPTGTARRWLPRGLEPVEVNHGVSLMGITVFDFTESPVGPYQELVLSLYVVPRLGIMEQHPHGAVYPLVLASTNRETREHAIDLWHLPHFNEDIYIEFTEHDGGRGISGQVYCHRGEPIVELSVSTAGKWASSYQLYQSFQGDESGDYVGIMDMQGSLNEHEERTGTVSLHEKHRFFDRLDLSDMDTLLCREMWMRDGVESYHDLLGLSSPTPKTPVFTAFAT